MRRILTRSLALLLFASAARAQLPLRIQSGGTNQTAFSNDTVVIFDGVRLISATAPYARSSSILNIDQKTAHGDSDYTVLSTDRTVALTAALTSPRTWTIPAASSVNAGQTITIVDLVGGVVTGSANTLSLVRTGSDTINGGTTVVLSSPYVGVTLVSDGISKWNAISGLGTITGGGGGTVAGTPIIQRDNFTGDGATTDFTASFAPASAGTLYVAVNGMTQANASYSISGSTLTISPALASGAGVVWAYYTTLPGTATQIIETFTSVGGTDFSLAHPPIPDGVEGVMLNGLTQNVTKYSVIAPDTIRFVSAPITGAAVTVTYLY